LKTLTILFVLFICGVAFATDDLPLTTPAPICTDDTHTMKIRRYVIIPPPDGSIEVHYNLCDSSGNVFRQGKLVLDGSDFTDVVNFQIRTQDVGVGIGLGLKQLIWNKIESVYGLEFQ